MTAQVSDSGGNKVMVQAGTIITLFPPSQPYTKAKNDPPTPRDPGAELR